MASKKSKADTPMDPGARESATPVQTTNTARTCHAIKQLVSEVAELFPETTPVYSNYDLRNTALDVQFDASMCPALLGLLELVESDSRVELVLIDLEEQLALVSFKSNPRTQDLRTPFNLADAWLILSDEAEFAGSY